MSIDIGKAAFSGFGLIGRRPVSVLVWGLVYAVLLGVPTLFLMSIMMPAYMQMFHDMAQAKASGASTAETNATMMQSMAQFQKIGALGWLINGIGIVVRGILIAAVFRAVLEPEKKGFFYLRLGAQEGWQMLLAIVLGILFVVLFFVIALIGGILVAVAGAFGSAAVIARVAIVLILVVVCAVIALRFSLAPPMTFAERNFRLFESWKLTRGHVGALLAIVLILVAMVLVFEAVVGGTVLAVVFSNKASLQGYFQNHPDPSAMFQKMTPFIIGGVAVGALLSGAILAIFVAPFATVYKQLTASTQAPAAFS